MSIVKHFTRPGIIAIIGDINEAKSNTLYYIINELREIGDFNLYVYGMRNEIKGSIKIHSINELESINDSIIIIDEVMSLWDLDNRMAKRQIENTLRLLNHRNNILVISAVPENVKKFISSKLDVIIYKKVKFEDFINGSGAKRHILNYKGPERGSNILNLGKDEAIVFDGLHYEKIIIPYLEKFDSKRHNVEIVNKQGSENVSDLVNKKDGGTA